MHSKDMHTKIKAKTNEDYTLLFRPLHSCSCSLVCVSEHLDPNHCDEHHAFAGLYKVYKAFSPIRYVQ